MPLTDSQEEDPAFAGSTSYIAEAYVRWVESHGARVVPIIYDQPVQQAYDLMDHLNGILFPGGGSGTGYYSFVK